MKSIGIKKLQTQANFEPHLGLSTSTRLIRQETEVKLDQLQMAEISFMNGNLQNQVKCYDWRAKTEFPIIKIYDYRIVKRDCLKTVMAVRHEHYPIRLDELKDLPLFKILYLLKESIIGFERLYDKFGPFLITTRMVALSRQNKCKIWLNQNFASNSFIQKKLTEATFLNSICSLFVGACNKLRNTVTFFTQLLQFQTFCQALAFIQNYARENKINIQNCCKIHQRELSIIQNKSVSNFDPSLTMNRSPKFLSNSNLRISLKPAAKINILNMATSKMIKESEAQECINMKTSGDTAADGFGNSVLASSQAEKEHIDQSIIFGEEQKSQKKVELVSRFNKSDTKYSKFSRCLSPNAETAQSYFSPMHSRKFEESYIQPSFKTENRINFREKQLQPEQCDNFLSQSVANVFNKNKWEKTLDGLFSSDQNLKKSTHEGKEKRKDELSTFKLSLLGSVGKNVRQSFFHEDHVHPYTSQF